MNEELSKKGLLEVKASVIKTYLEMLKEGNIDLVIDDLETELEVAEKEIKDIEVKEGVDKELADNKVKEQIDKIVANFDGRTDEELEEISSK